MALHVLSLRLSLWVIAPLMLWLLLRFSGRRHVPKLRHCRYADGNPNAQSARLSLNGEPMPEWRFHLTCARGRRFP